MLQARTAAILTLILLAGCASSPGQRINKMIQSGQCHAWSTDQKPVEVRVLQGFAYDARGGSGKPFLTWLDKRSITTLGLSSIRIAEFESPDRLSFKPLLGSQGPNAKLLPGGAVALSATDVGSIQSSPNCAAEEAALAAAGVLYLRVMRDGGGY